VTAREARLRDLRRAFLAEAEGDLEELVVLLAAAAPHLPAGEAARRARKLAHDLRGSGGSYGFHPVSAAAAAVEEALVQGRRADAAAALEALGAALARAAGEPS
jgi:HPt (histidine-containing phosphotransfer) domain-containing protein